LRKIKEKDDVKDKVELKKTKNSSKNKINLNRRSFINEENSLKKNIKDTIEQVCKKNLKEYNVEDIRNEVYSFACEETRKVEQNVKCKQTKNVKRKLDFNKENSIDFVKVKQSLQKYDEFKINKFIMMNNNILGRPKCLNPKQFRYLSKSETKQLYKELKSLKKKWNQNECNQIWMKLTKITENFSQRLVEQFRTILDPLLITKFGGEFRSGKRLNMKRIIPYIASKFRKDKIWLRRIKPTKRRYNIFLVIDDSKSMFRVSTLTLQTLATLSQTLNKLETGGITVLSFGENVELIHDCKQVFTNSRGAYCVSRFSFKQNKTDWCRMLEFLKKIAERKNVQENHMVQVTSIAFIISDARIQQDRQIVKGLLDEITLKKILIVLIIVDEDDVNQSVYNLTSVDYKGNEITISHYLDDFPFSFYTCLQNVAHLPNTLASLLRQWLELFRESNR